jgi:glutamyl-tRNA synthetase
MRGDDHVSNTPKQIAVYRALGAPLPAFGHVPNVNGMDGKKLSKRHGATAVGEYQKMGILPAAMRNFLALLGWSPGGDRELFFDLDELIQAFSLEAIQPKSAAFDLKKLEWMNGQYLMHLTPEELIPVLEPLLLALGLDPTSVPARRLAGIIGIAKQRSRTTNEAAKLAAVRLDARFIERDPKALQAIARDPAGFRAAIAAAAERLAGVPESAWEPAHLEQALRQLAETLGLAAGKVFQPIRVALTGLTATEPVHELLWAVGKADTISRLQSAATWTTAGV